MKRSPFCLSRPRCPLRIVGTGLCLLALMGSFAPVNAQPQPVEAVARPEIAKLAEIEVKAQTQNPAQQLAAFEGFLREYPQAPAPSMVRASVLASSLKFKLSGDAEGALAILRKAWDGPDLAASPGARLWLALEQAQLLNTAKKAAEAEAILSENWDVVAQTSVPESVWAYSVRVAALEGAGKTPQAIELLQDLRYDKPAFLDGTWDTDWMWDKIIQFHLAEAKVDKTGAAPALRWAKLRFMLCNFDEASLARATASLTLVWALTDAAQLPTFLAAQEDATKTNPLSAVAVPDLDGQKVPAVELPETRITLLLCSNTPLAQKRAMIEAFTLSIAPTTAGRGTSQVCRVFKACDLNTQRANAFLASFDGKDGAGQRAQLIAEFLAERKNAA